MRSLIRYPLRFGNITPINGQVNRSPRYPTLTPPPWARQRRSVTPLRSPTYEGLGYSGNRVVSKRLSSPPACRVFYYAIHPPRPEYANVSQTSDIGACRRATFGLAFSNTSAVHRGGDFGESRSGGIRPVRSPETAVRVPSSRTPTRPRVVRTSSLRSLAAAALDPRGSCPPPTLLPEVPPW